MRMTTSWLALLSLFAFVGCSHKPLVAPSGAGAYPYGKYQHQVEATIAQPTTKKMEMRGVISYTADRIQVVGLSAFGTTLFRIDENLKTGEIKKEFYLEIMSKHEQRFMEFYKLIRTLITAKKGQTQWTQDQAEFTLTQPDERGIYRHVQVKHPKVHLEIEVTDYEFL